MARDHSFAEPGRRPDGVTSGREMVVHPGSDGVLQGVPNFRDLGGIPAADGRVLRDGLLYRSELLSKLDAGPLAELVRLGIGTVFDLRNPSERASAPAAWPRERDRVSMVVMPVEIGVAGADVRGFLRRLASADLSVEEARATLLATYAAMPETFGPMLRQLFDTLARADAGAVLVHCTAGKDRTGFVISMLLHALRVPSDEIRRDYLSSARHYNAERLRSQMETLTGQPLDPRMADTLKALAEVQIDYLDSALARISRDWGSVDDYLRRQAGVDEPLRALLQARLLKPATGACCSATGPSPRPSSDRATTS